VGQRWIGFGTPELLADNVQGEANLHNLPWLTPKIVNSPLDLISSQGLFYAGFFAYFLFLPLALRTQLLEKVDKIMLFPRQSFMLLLTIWIPVTLSFVISLFTAFGPTRGAITEVRELFFSVAIFVYACSLARAAIRQHGGIAILQGWQRFVRSGN